MRPAGTDLAGIDLVVFDKDGTLIDFHAMWGAWARELGRRLEASSRRPVALDVFAAIGFDPSTGRVAPGGPLAVATMSGIQDVVATVLRRWLPHVAGVADAPADAGPLPQLAQPPPLDPAVLAALTGGDAGETRELLIEFLDSTGNDLAAVEAARNGGDLPGLAREAHKLKGASRMVGALELDQCAGRLEDASRAADWLAVPALVADVATAAERLRHHVAAHYPSL